MVGLQNNQDVGILRVLAASKILGLRVYAAERFRSSRWLLVHELCILLVAYNDCMLQQIKDIGRYGSNAHIRRQRSKYKAQRDWPMTQTFLYRKYSISILTGRYRPTIFGGCPNGLFSLENLTLTARKTQEEISLAVGI